MFLPRFWRNVRVNWTVWSFKCFLFVNLNQNWTNRVIRSVLKYLPIHSLLILFLSPQRFFYYSSEIFPYCFYENILEFSQYFISIFTIDYISAWQKNFILQLENDRWAIETSLLFNVNFHDSHRPNLLRTINLQLLFYEKISLHLIMHQSSWLELLGNIIHSGLVSIWLLPLPHHPRLQSVTQTRCMATELHTADQSDTQVSHNLK